MIIKCDYCNKEFQCCPSRFYNNKTHCCSKACAEALKLKERLATPEYLNTTCEICGERFHTKESHLHRYEHHCCSKECLTKFQSKLHSGENNSQYGLKGYLNPSWKSDERISSYGYKLIRRLDHPFANCDGFVFEHRLIAEEFLLTDECSVEVDGKRYLSPEYCVHHIDHNKLNNSVDNLIVMKKGEHVSLHNKMTDRQRNSKGQYI